MGAFVAGTETSDRAEITARWAGAKGRPSHEILVRDVSYLTGTFPLLTALRRAAACSRKASLAFFQLKMAAVIAPSGAKNAAPLNPPTRRPATKPAPAPQSTCGPR